MEQSLGVSGTEGSGRCGHGLGLGTIWKVTSPGLQGLPQVYRRWARLGHEEHYYRAIDQRFLGDEKFVQRISERAPQSEIRPRRPKIQFETLLHAMAQVHDCQAKELTAKGRRRAWVGPRVQLAYLAREWCGMKTTGIARRLNRDASMISRLFGEYETAPDQKTEHRIAGVVGK